MKRKFISALLFGALIAASTSTFVSCAKDYDGDIAELREKITGNATDLSSLVDEKVKNVQAEIDALTAQQSALEAAYKEADKALEEAIKNATNDAQGYADIQAAEAQKAAIAAAEEMVSTAAASLQAGLDAANAKLDEQGKTVEGLLAADKELSVSINDAKQRADNAYTLATANGESITKISSDLREISSSLSTVESNVTTLQGTVNEALTQANKNKADLDALKTQLGSLSGDNATALKNLSDKDDELQKLIEDNQEEIESALADEAKAREEADKNLREAIDVVTKSYDELKGKVETAQTDIATLKSKAEDLDSAIKKEAEERKEANEELSNSIKKLEKGVETINIHLAVLFENLDNLITGIIVQDTTQIKMLYAQVKNSKDDLDQTNAAGLTIFETGKAYFPYKGAPGVATLATQKYNVEKNIGLLYFTLNPNTIDFNNKANLGLENSLGEAPSGIEVGTVKSASDYLITRAAANNGLYQAPLTNTKAVMDKAPSYNNSFALYTKYTSINAEGDTIGHRVYSKYEINLKATEATAEVQPSLSATGTNSSNLDGNTGWLFTATNGTLTGTLKLGTTGDNKAYAKYVEVSAVKNSTNTPLSGDALKNAKADFAAKSTGINKVLYEAQDGEKDNLFDQITVGVSDTYNGYTFTLRYFIQQYDGVVRMETKDVRFTKPMFTSQEITVEATPTSSSSPNEAEVSADELKKLAYMTGSGNDYNTWKANTKYLAISDDAPIKSVKFGYSTSSTVEVSKGHAADISSTILSGDKKVTKVIVNYDPKDFVLGEEYSFNIGSYDTNGNEVTTTKVTVKMERPTFADAKLVPNPAFAPDGTLTVWARYDSGNGIYVISNAFNAPIYESNQWALRLDLDNAESYKEDGDNKAFMPTSGISLVSSDVSTPLTMKVPAAALQVTELNEKGEIENVGTEHTYTILYGPQYFGLSNLWDYEYTGSFFEKDGASFGEHKFNIVFKSPVYYAAKEAKFKKSEYEVDFPKGSTTISDDEIEAKNPSASKDDAFSFLATTEYDIDKAEVVLIDTKYKGLFKEYKVDGSSIKIETIETGTVNTTTVKFALRVTDKFGNVADIPFTVKVKGNN